MANTCLSDLLYPEWLEGHGSDSSKKPKEQLRPEIHPQGLWIWRRWKGMFPGAYLQGAHSISEELEKHRKVLVGGECWRLRKDELSLVGGAGSGRRWVPNGTEKTYIQEGMFQHC